MANIILPDDSDYIYNSTLEQRKKDSNNKFLITDLLHGDESVSKRSDFESMSHEEIRNTIRLITNNNSLSSSEKNYLMQNLWRVSYRQKPPTIQDFLTTEWIGETSKGVFPHVKKDLETFWSPDSYYRHLLLAPNIGYGKANLNSSLVFTPSGYKKMGDIEIGDIISTPNGKTAKVLKVFPQGKLDIFEVTFKDGRKTRVTENHLWKVTKSTNNKIWDKELKISVSKKEPLWKVRTTKELVTLGLYQNNKTKSPKWKIPLTNPVYHEKVNHYIKPYSFGVLLGDGSFRNRVQFTNIDQYIIDRMHEECPDDCRIRDYNIQHIYTKKKNIHTNLKCGIVKEIERLNLYGELSNNKFIPDEYLFDSVENRIQLLQGLMDSDGTTDKDGRTHFSTSSEKLKDQIMLLVRGLGGTASFSILDRRETKNNTNSLEYIVFISFPNNNFPIFRLKRKQDRVDNRFNRKRNRSGTQMLSITSITKVESDDATCILLDDEDHLYLTDDYIVTHNSLESAISVLYTMTHINLMRAPKQFFGVLEASSIVAILGSFTLAKAKQVLLKPFINILQSSPKFRKVKQEDRIEKAQREENEDGSNKIVWTTASKMDGAIQFSNDLHILIVSDFSALLGLSIITGVLSEISFFLEKGISPDDISRMYNDLKGRVRSRFGEKYFATTIIDSSPNSFDSPIDKYIFSGEAAKEERNYVVTANHWDTFRDIKPEDYPKWIATGETFPLFRGDGSKPPVIIQESQRKDYPSEEVKDIPIDLLNIFEQDINKATKDFLGWPSGGDSKLISNYDYIENMFTKQLKNIETYIKAPADQRPDRLIWDQIVNKFFIKIGENNYEFYRSPKELRYIAIDLAESRDCACIAMVHPEINNSGEIIIVTDFTITIIPGKERINLDAIEYFIFDLKRLGKINIAKVTYDQYQSSGSRQNFEREGFDVERFSVDIDMAPYMVYISWIKNGRVKSGRSIFLKNNLKSLQETTTEKGRKKIDHLKGKLVYDDGKTWEHSLCGINAKDTSDAHAGAVFQAINNYRGVPRYQWVENINNEEDISNNIKTKVLADVYEKYSFYLRN